MKKIILLLSLAALAACSGGGDGGDDPVVTAPGETTVVQRASLTGLAVKGLAQQAKVSAYTLSGSVFNTTADVTGLTDSAGRYNIRLSEDSAGYAGPLKIVLSYNNADSKLQCDDNSGCVSGSVAAGAFYAMPQDFELSSIVNVGSGLTNSNDSTVVNISALSTLAAKYLEDGGDAISTNTLKTSNNQIRAVFSLSQSVDLVSTEPQVVSLLQDGTVDGDAESNGDAVYGAINAAFLKVANAQGDDITSLIEDYAQELIDQDGQLYLNPPTAEQDAPSILKITTAAIGLSVLEGDDLTDVTAVKTTAAAAPAGQITDVNPPSISAGNDQSVASGVTVSIPTDFLTNSSVTNPVYLWQVLSGPLSLVGNNTAITDSLSFTAPTTGGDIKLRVIIESDEGSDNDIVIIKVQPAISTDTSGSGSYQISNLFRNFIGGGSQLNKEYDISLEEVNVTFRATGTGTIYVDSPTKQSKSYESSASLNTPGSITLQQRQFYNGDIGTDDLFSVDFTQLASGSLLLNLPAGLDEDLDVNGDGSAEIIEAANIDFYNLGPGLYAGFKFELSTDYLVTNNVRAADPLAKSIGYEFLTLSKDNSAITDMSGFANKKYTFIDLRTILEPSVFRMVGSKGSMVFDATATSFDVTEKKAELSGIPNMDQAGGINGTYTMTVTPEGAAETNPTSIFTTIENGRFGIGLGATPGPDTIVSNDVASDFSAFTTSQYYYANTVGTDFATGTPSSDEVVSGVYIEIPTTPVDLNNKVFDVTVINYLVENDDNAAVSPIAPEVILEKYSATITLTDGEMKFYAQSKAGKLSYGNVVAPSGTFDVDVNYRSEPKAEGESSVLTTTLQDVDGCVKQDTDNFEFCVSDNGAVVGWNYGTTVDGNYSNHSVNMFVGKLRGDYVDTSLKFVKADLSGSTFNLTFSDGVAPYTFVSDGTGSVTFPNEAAEAFEWSIDGQGRIVLVLTVGGDIDRYTLTSGDEVLGQMTLEVDGGDGLGYQVAASGLPWAKQ